MAESKQKAKRSKTKAVPAAPLEFGAFVQAIMATGRPPAQKKKAAKRRPRKGRK